MKKIKIAFTLHRYHESCKITARHCCGCCEASKYHIKIMTKVVRSGIESDLRMKILRIFLNIQKYKIIFHLQERKPLHVMQK